MRLINWNIQWGRDARGHVDLARTVDTARALADFDLLCVQELTRGFETLPGGPSSDQYAELSALLPGYTVHEAIAVDLPPRETGAPRRQFGNALATRLPVERVLRHTLPWPACGAAPSMPRSALEVTIDVDGALLRVLVTHLEYYSAAQRLAQIDALRALHREAAAHARIPAPPETGSSPFATSARAADAILCGDFNSPWDGDAYRRLLTPFDDTPAFVDAWTHTHPGAPPPPTAGCHDTAQWPDGPLTCDFVFVTAPLAERIERCEIDGATQASDHQPIVLELRAR
jgi:endonuclease/exonuclease/phosphatase family metal-dependent hydrolase